MRPVATVYQLKAPSERYPLPSAAACLRLDVFLHELEAQLQPLPVQLDQAERAARHLTGAFQGLDSSEYAFDRAIPFGSSSRGTATAPLKDCDRLLCFRRIQSPRRGLPSLCPEAFLDTITEHMQHRLFEADLSASWWLRAQSHSVGLSLGGGLLSVDLVPVIQEPNAHRVWLPERQSRRWIMVHPHAMCRRLLRLSQQQSTLISAIQLLKSWKRAHNLHFTSYGIELLQAQQASRARRPRSLTAFVWHFLRTLAHSDPAKPLIFGTQAFETPASLSDPWTGANVLSGLSVMDRHALVRHARNTLNEVQQELNKTGPLDSSLRRVIQQHFIGEAAHTIQQVHAKLEPANPFFLEYERP